MCHHRGYEHLREYESMRERESDAEREIEIVDESGTEEARDGEREPVVPPADD